MTTRHDPRPVEVPITVEVLVTDAAGNPHGVRTASMMFGPDAQPTAIVIALAEVPSRSQPKAPEVPETPEVPGPSAWFSRFSIHSRRHNRIRYPSH